MYQSEQRKKRIQLISNLLWGVNLLVFTILAGTQGVSYMSLSLELFILFVLASSYLLPDSIMRVMKIRLQKGQVKNAERLFGTSVFLGIVISGAGTLIFFILSLVQPFPYAELLLKLFIIPIWLITFCQVFRGYFQGNGSFVPTEISKILEQIIFFISNLFILSLFRNYGEKVAAFLQREELESVYASFSIVVSLSIACVFALLFFLLLFIVQKGGKRRGMAKEKARMREGVFEQGKLIGATMLSGALFYLCGRIPIFYYGVVFEYRNRQQADAFYEFGGLYGILFPIVLIFVMLIMLIASKLSVSAVMSLKREEYRIARENIFDASHLIVICGAFLSVFLIVMAEPLEKLFSATTGKGLTQVFQIGGILVIFFSLTVFLQDVLIGIGKKKIVLIVQFIAMGLQIGLGSLFFTVFHMGIEGILVSILIAFLLQTGVLGFLLVQALGLKPEWIQLFCVPIGISAFVGLVLFLIVKGVLGILGSLPVIIIGFVVGFLIYTILLVLLRGVRKEEISQFGILGKWMQLLYSLLVKR